MMNQRRTNDTNMNNDIIDDHETNPIILSKSEDIIELDTSDAELQKIASKYTKRRDHERNRRLLFFVATILILSTLVTFTFIRSKRHYWTSHSTHDNNNTSSSNNGNGNGRKVPSHPEYKHLKSKFLPGYQASMHHYKHKKTHAEFIAFSPLDTTQDKTFGVSFRTKPLTNTGVAHILEHSVLSGMLCYVMFLVNFIFFFVCVCVLWMLLMSQFDCIPYRHRIKELPIKRSIPTSTQRKLTHISKCHDLQ